jgi:hypothetical protein
MKGVHLVLVGDREGALASTRGACAPQICGQSPFLGLLSKHYKINESDNAYTEKEHVCLEIADLD